MVPPTGSRLSTSASSHKPLCRWRQFSSKFEPCAPMAAPLRPDAEQAFRAMLPRVLAQPVAAGTALSGDLRQVRAHLGLGPARALERQPCTPADAVCAPGLMVCRSSRARAGDRVLMRHDSRKGRRSRGGTMLRERTFLQQVATPARPPPLAQLALGPGLFPSLRPAMCARRPGPASASGASPALPTAR